MISERLRTITHKEAPSEADVLEVLEDIPLATINDVLHFFGDLVYAGFITAARQLLVTVKLDKDSYAYWLMQGILCFYEDLFAEAESAFLKAHDLSPEEVAIHVNIAQLFAKQQRKEEAVAWIDAGLQLDANHFQLWEQLYLIAPDMVQDLAKKYRSWVGMHLYVSAFHSGRAEILTEVFAELSNYYLKDDDFLIEYSAALGQCNAFDSITNLAWRVEHADHSLHWKFAQHVAQAYFETEKLDQGMKYLKKALRHKEIPPSVARSYADEIKRYEESL
jgi:tetratricopeptide (TPR) repeat protein